MSALAFVLSFGRRVRGTVLGGCATAVLAAGGGDAGVPTGDHPKMTPVTFHAQQHRIPGAPVLSNTVEINGMGETVEARVVVGEAVDLIVNGASRGEATTLSEGDRLRLRTSAPATRAAEKHVAIGLGEASAVWSISTINVEPPDRFEFRERDDIAAGGLAYSGYVAPTFFAPGSALRVESDGSWRIETARGQFTRPVQLLPGDIFQIVAQAPEEPGRTREVVVSLGGRSTVWEITSVD